MIRKVENERETELEKSGERESGRKMEKEREKKVGEREADRDKTRKKRLVHHNMIVSPPHHYTYPYTVTICSSTYFNDHHLLKVIDHRGHFLPPHTHTMNHNPLAFTARGGGGSRRPPCASKQAKMMPDVCDAAASSIDH